MTFFVAVGLVLLVAEVVAGISQGRRVVFDDIELYAAVLDDVFRYERVPKHGPLTILRYTHGHADELEMQLSYAKTPSGAAYRVERWTLPRGTASIWQQLEKLSMMSSLTLDRESAVRSIRLERSVGVVAADSPIGRLLERGSTLNLSLSLSDELVLDAKHYLLVITSISREVRVSIRGPADGEKALDPIVRWMSHVRREIRAVEWKEIGRPGVVGY